MATPRRRRRGHPRGKAFGFNNMRPAAKSSSGGSTNSDASQDSSDNTQDSTSAPSSGS